MQPNKIKINKKVEVLEIFPSVIEEYWNLVDFMLREGLKYDGNPMNINDLKKFIKEGQMQLFIMFGSDDGKQYKVFGVCVTRITALPNFNQCEVILLKGEKRELWQDELANVIESLAKSSGCKRIAVHARPGWQPFLKTKGWEVKRYLYTKEIK
jgi:hypothetical protein|tara:strand:+ start:911 stop:1372 length:462 start_codon:yes stop_codon:yes gene_type:complete